MRKEQSMAMLGIFAAMAWGSGLPTETNKHVFDERSDIDHSAFLKRVKQHKPKLSKKQKAIQRKNK